MLRVNYINPYDLALVLSTSNIYVVTSHIVFRNIPFLNSISVVLGLDCNSTFHIDH